MNPLSVYEGSDAAQTKALYCKLESIGPIGLVALNLFRAQKCSARAKVYRGGIPGGGSFKDMAYTRKAWSLLQLNTILMMHHLELRIPWGWAKDPSEKFVPWVLYIDLPQGQVSFHSIERYNGPDYPRGWDGQHKSAERILAFVSEVLDSEKRNLSLF
jgi:hypothetical protein